MGAVKMLFLTVVSIVVIILGTADSLRVLGIFPLNSKSHFVMMEPLMKKLAEKGHTVDVISHFPQKRPLPNYNDISLEGSLPPSMNNIMAENLTKFNSFSFATLMYMAGDKQCELLDLPAFQKLINDPPKYDAVIFEV